MAGRRLPSDVEAERALLGCLLLSPQACMTVILDEDLQPSEFFSPLHQQIYATIRALFEAGDQIDVVTVRAANPSIETSDLLAMQADTPRVSSAGRYSAVVREMAVRRRLVQFASEVSQAAMNGDARSEEVIRAAEAGLSDVVLAAEALGGGIEGYYESPRTLMPEGWSIDDLNPWKVPTLLRAEESGIVVADAGLGKSTLLRQIAYCAENSLHWLTGRRIRGFDPQRALLIECESRKHNVAQSAAQLRIAVARHLGCSPSEIREPGVLMSPGKFDVRDPRTRSKFVRLLREVKPDIVCIGPLKNLHSMRPGEPYEVAAVETQAVFDELKARFGFALMLESHANRSDPGRVAGSARWADWPDFGFSLQVPDKDVPGGSEIEMDLIRFRMDRNPECRLPVQIIRAKRGAYLPMSCGFSEERTYAEICDQWGTGYQPPAPPPRATTV